MEIIFGERTRGHKDSPKFLPIFTKMLCWSFKKLRDKLVFMSSLVYM